MTEWQMARKVAIAKLSGRYIIRTEGELVPMGMSMTTFHSSLYIWWRWREDADTFYIYKETKDGSKPPVFDVTRRSQ